MIQKAEFLGMTQEINGRKFNRWN